MRRIFLFALFLMVLFVAIPKNEIVGEAKDIYVDCDTSSEQETCYANAFAAVAQKHDIAYTLAVLEKFITLRGKPSCHFIGHVVANVYVKKNLPLWKDIFAKMPEDLCSGGLQMGTLEAAATYGVFQYNREEITNVCQSLAQSSHDTSVLTCIHTMGHLVLTEQKGDIDGAIVRCQSLEEKYRYECFAGVFMEHLFKRNLSAMGIASEESWDTGKAEEYITLCSRQEGIASQACWRELSHVFLYLTKNVQSETDVLCGRAARNREQAECSAHARRILNLTGHDEHFVN